MPKNLNSFVLTDKIIDIMKQKISKTENIRREFGFNLCHIEGSKELKDDTHCIGTECRMPLAKICKIGKKVGTFHTHPRSDSTPSLPDLWDGYYYGTECIGGTVDKKVVCYIRKDKELDPKINRMFAANIERFRSLGAEKEHHITKEKGYQTYMSKYRDMIYTRDFLQKKYFDTVSILG
jgi:hypothetical protein